MGNGSRVITTKLFHFSWLGTWKILLHYHSSVFFLEKFVITKLCRISFTKRSSVQMLTCQNERICEKISFSREKRNADWLGQNYFWFSEPVKFTGSQQNSSWKGLQGGHGGQLWGQTRLLRPLSSWDCWFFRIKFLILSPESEWERTEDLYDTK